MDLLRSALLSPIIFVIGFVGSFFYVCVPIAFALNVQVFFYMVTYESKLWVAGCFGNFSHVWYAPTPSAFPIHRPYRLKPNYSENQFILDSSFYTLNSITSMPKMADAWNEDAKPNPHCFFHGNPGANWKDIIIECDAFNEIELFEIWLRMWSA